MDDENYRKVDENDYFCGYNSNGKHESQLIVYELNDKSLAREYEKKNLFWNCIGCKALKEKVHIKIQNGGEIYAPLQHSCTPRNMDIILAEQKSYRNIALFGDGKNISTHQSVYDNSPRFEKFEEDEYEFGVNHVRRPDSVLIVQHKTNKNLVYHYFTTDKKWYCSKCYSSSSKEKKYGVFLNNSLYLPKNHFCLPILRKESMKEQAALLSDDSEADVLYNKHRGKLRIVDPCDFVYGVTSKLRKLDEKKLLIVCDPECRNIVKEYSYKFPSVWQCLRCYKKKYDSFAILKNEKLYVSKSHKCETKSYKDSMEKQVKLLNHGKSHQEVNSLIALIDKRMPLSLKMESYCLSSPSCIISSNISPSPSSSSSSSVSSTVPQHEESYNQRPTRSRTAVVQQEALETNLNDVTSVSNIGVQRRFPRSRTSTAPAPSKSITISSSSNRKRGRPSKNSLPRSNSISSVSESSQSTLMEIQDNESSDAFTENLENIPERLSNHSSKRRSQNSSLLFDPFYQEQQPSSKKIKANEPIHLNFTIPQLVPNEPFAQSAENQEFDEEVASVNQPISELWAFDDDQNNKNTGEKYSSLPQILQNDVELNEENYQNVTETTFNTTVDTTDPKIKEVDFYIFKPLTNATHTTIIQKLNIPLNGQNVTFLEVKIDAIKSTSVPGETVEISAEKDSFFKSLSCLFTCEETYWDDIRWGIRKYFFENFETFENYENIDFSKMVMFDDTFLAIQSCHYISPLHLNYICKWLEIRIGVFRNTEFEKYGNWENKESPILLFKNDKGFFEPVISLA